ncbi:hypothetical protein HDU67_003927 [Dinochytrium kinnereticum]|nr:hypothetical protein HDU67_003927 [Dinochytrium kinnereticum]
MTESLLRAASGHLSIIHSVDLRETSTLDDHLKMRADAEMGRAHDVDALRESELTGAIQNDRGDSILNMNDTDGEDVEALPLRSEHDEGTTTSATGTDLQDDFLDHQTTVQRLHNTLFSILYFAIQGRPPLHFVLHGMAVVLEDLQLLSFFFAEEISKAYAIPKGMTSFIRVIPGTIEARDFLVKLGLALAPIFIMVFLLGWITVGYLSGVQKAGFAITTFRILAVLLPSLFFIPILDIALVAFDCGNSINQEKAYNSFGSLPCMSDSRVSAKIAAAFALAAFLPLSLCLSGLFWDINPTQKSFFHKIHGRVDVCYLLMKVLLVVLYRFLDPSLAAVKTGVATIRGGFYCAGILTGTVATIASIYSMATGKTIDYTVLAAMEFTLVAGFALGYFIIGKAFNYIQTTVQERLDMLINYNNDDEDLLIFPLLPNVEIAARIATAHMTNRNRKFNEKNMPLIKKIFSRGVYEFPSEGAIRVPFAIYMFFTNFSEREVNLQISRAKAIKPVWDLRFQLFCVNQLSNQRKEMDFLGAGVRLDVAGQAEFKKLDREAKVNHFLAVQEMRTMWKFVRQKNFDLDELSRISTSLYTHAEKAQSSYMKLVSKFPRSKLILRYFAHFCTDVTKDISRAEALVFKADEIESQENNMIGISPEDDFGNHVVNPKMIKSRSGFDYKLPRFQMLTTSNRASSVKRKTSLRVPSEGASDVDARSNGRSEPMSATRKVEQAKKDHRKARLTRDVFRVRTYLSVSCLVVLGLILAAFFNLNQIWGSWDDDFRILQWLEDRTFNIAELPRRVQQLRYAENPEQFLYVQKLVVEEMKNLSTAHYSLYKYDKSHKKSGYATDFIISAVESNYPATKSTTIIPVNLFTFVSNYLKSGIEISSVSMQYLQATSENNDIRYIIDNFRTAEDAFDVLVEGGFLETYWDFAYHAQTIVFAITASTALVIIISFIFADLILRKFKNRQSLTLEVFRYIPKNVSDENIHSLKDATSPDIFSSNIAKLSNATDNSKWLSTLTAFKIQYVVSSATLIALSLVFCFANVHNLFENARVMSTLHDVSELRTHFSRCDAALTDILRSNESGSQGSLLLENYDHAVGTLVELFDAFRFGSESRRIPIYTQNPQAAIDLLEHGQCLPLNTSLCCETCREWNDKIGYSKTLLTSGLFHLSTIATETHSDFLRAYASGILPDSKRSEIIRLTIEPDILDGWQQIRLILIQHGLDTYKQIVTANYVILAFELIIIVVGYSMEFYFIERMLSRYRFADQCMSDMFSRLPPHVRRVPQIAMLLGAEEDEECCVEKKVEKKSGG